MLAGLQDQHLSCKDFFGDLQWTTWKQLGKLPLGLIYTDANYSLRTVRVSIRTSSSRMPIYTDTSKFNVGTCLCHW